MYYEFEFEFTSVVKLALFFLNSSLKPMSKFIKFA